MQGLYKLLYSKDEIVEQKSSIVYWQQRFYAVMVVFTIIGGLIMSVAGAVAFVSEGIIIGAVINITIYSLGIFFLSNRKITFKTRKTVIVLMYYYLGIHVLMLVGERSAWMLLILVAFVTAGFLLDRDDIKMYTTFNVILFTLITVFYELGYLDHLSIVNYGRGWYVNLLSVQLFGFFLVSINHFMLQGMQQQSEIITKSERSLISTLNAMDEGVVVIDYNGLIVRHNPFMSEHYGLMSSEESPLHINEIFELVEDLDDDYKRDLFSYLLNKNEAQFRVRLEPRGEIYYFGCRMSPISDEDNLSEGYVIMFHDITAMKEEEVNLRQTQKMEAIGTMAGGVAHDFNNMLGGILGYAELSREAILDRDCNLYRYNEEITKTSLKASELTKQLLAYARRKEMKREAIDLNQCVISIGSMMERTFDKKIEIELRTLKQALMVYGDGASLENAILNMGLNARDAMPLGGKLKISVGRSYLDESFCKASSFHLVAGTYIHLKVKDEGVGMSREVLGKVFEPFFTTKEIGKGTGLGMAATYGTIVAHGGAISVESVEGVGTEVTIYLPIYSGINTIQVEKEVGKVGPMTHSGRILLIDDEEVIRSMVKEILEMLGYEVDVASDGYEGIEIYERNSDLYRGVLLDMIMPKLSGREVFTMIKAVNPEAKVIMISGFIDETHVDELFALGINGFVKKPFTIESIVEALAVLE